MRITILLPLILLATSAHAGVQATDDGILFSYEDAMAVSVHVAGDFNDWNTSATALSDDDGDGVWTVLLDLGAGTYQYKFVVDGGTWVTDPDNPRTGGDFGNSVVEVGADGGLPAPAVETRPAVPSGTPSVSNTPLHSRVHIGGFFRMEMEGASDAEGDARLRLDRPDDQFNLDVTANLSDDLWGSLRLKLETGEGGANEIATELYKAQSNFIDEDFQVKAYYNEEVYSSDEPFELLGHLDLRGTVREEHRDFGQGTQGVLLTMQPFDSDLTVLYADTFDEDIFNPEEPTLLDPDKAGLNQSTGTDVLLGRLTRQLGEKTRLGVTYRGEFSDWWVNFTSEANATYPDELVAHREAQVRDRDSDKSDNFELANDHHTAALDATYELREDTRLRAAGGWGWYDARWSLGNREEIQGTGFVNGPVDINIGNETEWRGELEVANQFRGLRSRISHEIRTSEGMDAGENFVTFRTTPGSMLSDRDIFADTGIITSYDDVNGSDGVDILRLGSRPMRTNHITEIDLGYDLDDVELVLELDRTRDNLGYESFFGGASKDLDRWSWRASPRLAWRPFESSEHFVGVEAEVVRYEDWDRDLQEQGALAPSSPSPGQGGGSLLRLDNTELLFRGLLPAGQFKGRGLSFHFDLRWIQYDGPEGLTDADDNVLDLSGDFFASYAALVWKPAEAVQVHVGYGVDPTFYDVISPEGWPNGRQQFRDAFLIEQRLDPYYGPNILLAEEALQDRRQFVINALVRF